MLCSECGTRATEDARFCASCGRRFAAVAAAAPTAPTPPVEVGTAPAPAVEADDDPDFAPRARERPRTPVVPGSPEARAIEGHMLAAGLLLVGLGGMLIALPVAFAALGRSVTPTAWVPVGLVGGWLIAEGLGLRGLQGWARVMLAVHVIGNVAVLLFRAEPVNGSASFVGAALGIGLPLAMMMTAYSAPPGTFTKAYRESPARLNGPKATPYRSPFFWIACLIGALGVVMSSYAIAG